MPTIARPKHERAAIADAREALAEWHELDEWRDKVEELYREAEESGDYEEADENGADLNEAQVGAGEVLAGAVLMLLRALGELPQAEEAIAP